MTISVAPLLLRVTVERWPLINPFRIAGHLWEALDVIMVTLGSHGKEGRAEAAGVYYHQETPEKMRAQIEAVRGSIEAGIDRMRLSSLLPPGGARNALDCALWDLEAQLCGVPAWQRAGLATPHPLLTTLTCGAEAPEQMAARAAGEYQAARAIKLKLLGDDLDAERVCAVRAARPEVWLGVDANQGLTRASLERLLPTLVDARVKLIEQPFPVGSERWLDGLHSPISIAADESVQTLDDVRALAGRFKVINIKLDKCGGLTEGLAMARLAASLGLEIMVGNMLGTSLAMAPAYLLGQLCQVVDLDGPVFLDADRSEAVTYSDGSIHCPQGLWGFPR